MDKSLISAEITMYSEAEGGRHCMPEGTGYSPYFVVNGSTDYLAVTFIDVPHDAKPNRRFIQTVELRYPSIINYNALKEGVRFKITEGNKLIGEGTVTKASNHDENLGRDYS